jgi:hypothetical protein
VETIYGICDRRLPVRPRLILVDCPPIEGITLAIEPGTEADDLEAAAERSLRRDLPDGARLEIGESQQGVGASGWSVTLIQARVFGEDGYQLESRIVALYTIADWIEGIRMVARDRDVYEAHRPAVLATLVSADVEWPGDRAVGLADALGAHSDQ